jgi:hypothetical protein
MNADIEHNDVTLDSYDKNTAAVSDHEEAATIIEGTVVRKRYRATIESVESDRAVQTDIDDENRNFDAFDQKLDDDIKPAPRYREALHPRLRSNRPKINIMPRWRRLVTCRSSIAGSSKPCSTGIRRPARNVIADHPGRASHKTHAGL